MNCLPYLQYGVSPARIHDRWLRNLFRLALTDPLPRAQNTPFLLAQVAPHGWEHIGLNGDYVRANLPPTAQFRSPGVQDSSKPWRF